MLDDRYQYRVSARELFDRVGEVLASVARQLSPADGYRANVLHELLVMACHEGVRDTDQTYGNLFAQVDFLCKKHHIQPADRIAIQTMRRHSNRREALSRDDLLYDIRALCLFVSAVFGVDIPADIVPLIPAVNRPRERGRHVDYKYIRCIVDAWDADGLCVTASDGGHFRVDCSAEHLRYLEQTLQKGMQLNLLDCTKADDGELLVPSLVVVEPDFLIDISSIARCFEQYGHHPLNFMLNRMADNSPTQPILLGHLAGMLLDDTIHCYPENISLRDTIRRNFQQRATAFCTSTDFRPEPFLSDAASQAENIRQAVGTLFAQYDRQAAVLEPSFVCERLGINGRVDLMTTDFSLLVEQKSGRNWSIETGRPDEHGSMMPENNYVQLLLYYGVLRYNFNLGFDTVNMRLLYSKYPAAQGLVAVNFFQQLFREAIQLRNLIVAWELYAARHGFAAVLPLLTPETVNVKRLSNRFFNTWKLPSLQQICSPMHRLSPLEQTYFCRMMTFVYREQRVNRLGVQEGISACSSDLWNMPLSEKLETGNIYMNLTVKERRKQTPGGGFDLITLHVPQQGDDFLPNFRTGDMVYLYAYRDVPDVRRSILYKGVLAEIHTGQLSVALSDGQQNPDVMRPGADGGEQYAIEHAPADTATSAIRSLHAFISAPPHMRELLLAQRRPQADEAQKLACRHHPDYDEVVERALRARDYFLLVGPPGTGKTSMALRFLVEEHLAAGDVLLMSYTNRAVDEICAMLSDAGIGYVRMGSEHRCAPRFRSHLLQKMVESAPRLDALRRQLTAARVVVGTTTTMMNHAELFRFKHFALAIVDEASQILEPDIVGLLVRVPKFILVGDHKQLPAVVQQTAADSAVDSPELHAIGLYDCRNSLFERLLRVERQAGRTAFVGILRKQGRMHPAVADFSNRMFYARERLEPVPLPHQEELHIYPAVAPEAAVGMPFLDRRVLFIPSPCCRQEGVSDKVNTAEARIVAALVGEIGRRCGQHFSAQATVGIIVPYRNQIAVIRREIERLQMPLLNDITIDTVERYQGSQRDIIIYSFTIQRTCQLEFLTANTFVEEDIDGTRRLIDRKLNVALTRARKQLILTGNEHVLQCNPLFAQLMQYVRQKGGWVDAASILPDD